MRTVSCSFHEDEAKPGLQLTSPSRIAFHEHEAKRRFQWGSRFDVEAFTKMRQLSPDAPSDARAGCFHEDRCHAMLRELSRMGGDLPNRSGFHECAANSRMIGRYFGDRIVARLLSRKRANDKTWRSQRLSRMRGAVRQIGALVSPPGARPLQRSC